MEKHPHPSPLPEGEGVSSDFNHVMALLHKDFKDRAFLSYSNLSDNLGMRSA